jgi:hypothetical protein
MLLAEVADIQMGYSFRSRLEPDPTGDVLVIQMKDVDDANLLHPERATRVRLAAVKPRHLLRAGDIVFRSRGRTYGAALVQEGIGTAVLAGPMLLIRPQSLLPAYLCWLLNSPAVQASLMSLAAGTAVRMVSVETLKALDIPVPDAETQQRICHVASLAAQEERLLNRIGNLRRRATNHLLMKSAHEAKS